MVRSYIVVLEKRKFNEIKIDIQHIYILCTTLKTDLTLLYQFPLNDLAIFT